MILIEFLELITMLAIAYLGLILFIIFVEVIRKRSARLDFLTLFSIFFVLLYPLPAFLLEANFGNANSILTIDSVMDVNNHYYISEPKTAVAIFLGYFLVLIGFQSKSANLLAKRITIQECSDKRVLIFAIGFLLFGCLSIQIYSAQYGGLLIALTNVTLIRSVAFESGPLVFFKNFIFYSFIASYLLGSLIFIRSTQKTNIFLHLLFLFSIAASFIAASLTAGRGPLIYYVLVFYFVYIIRTGKLFSKYVFLLGVALILFILFGKQFYWSLSALPNGFDAMIERFTEAVETAPDSGTDNISTLYKLMSNFSYPVISLDAALNGNYEIRFFIDWIYGFLSFIPERIFGIEKPQTTGYLNTLIILNRTDTEIPPAFLAFGVYSLSWLGLVIVAYTYGWIGLYLQTVCERYLQTVTWMPFIYALIAIVWIDFQPAGDPKVFLTNNFWSLTAVGLLFFVIGKARFRKSHNINNSLIS